MPEVRQTLSFPLGHGVLEIATRRRIGKGLAGQYDQAILLPNSLKSALVPFFAGIPTRTGWKGELRYGLLNDIRVLDKDRYPLMIERFMALAFEPGAELPKPYPRPESADRPGQPRHDPGQVRPGPGSTGAGAVSGRRVW